MTRHDDHDHDSMTAMIHVSLSHVFHASIHDHELHVFRR